MAKHLPKGKSPGVGPATKHPSAGPGQSFRDYNPIPVPAESGQSPPTEAKPLPQRKQLAGMD